jgi:hypothetical protein
MQDLSAWLSSSADREPSGLMDADLLSEIGRLTNQRQLLRESHAGKPMSAEKTQQLTTMDSALDDVWSTLRRRRARRRAGLGPD